MKPSVSELVSTRSVSDNKTIEATSSCVFVPNHTVVVVATSLSLDLEELTQVLEQLHLIAEVLGVILDMSLMGTEVLHHILLLSQLKRILTT
jgi:Mrp family chromosome partitioning ATPase